MEKPSIASMNVNELVEALMAISIVAKSLAKKVVMQSIKFGKTGGENDGKIRCSCKTKTNCK
ncbi:MAG: hypothetical protein WCX96_01525 [Bacilli bacterium]